MFTVSGHFVQLELWFLLFGAVAVVADKYPTVHKECFAFIHMPSHSFASIFGSPFAFRSRIRSQAIQCYQQQINSSHCKCTRIQELHFKNSIQNAVENEEREREREKRSREKRPVYGTMIDASRHQWSHLFGWPLFDSDRLDIRRSLAPSVVSHILCHIEFPMHCQKHVSRVLFVANTALLRTNAFFSLSIPFVQLRYCSTHSFS